MKTHSSWYQRALATTPGAVHSPIRSFRAVHEPPIWVQQGQGAYLIDIEGHCYIDYVGGFGPMILGHAHPRIVHVLRHTIENGLCFGTSHPLETQLAEMICTHVKGSERIRFVNSGTEAALVAIRLARAVTNRPKILKFAECYHGHSDALLISKTPNELSSSGIPFGVAKDVCVAHFNNTESVDRIFERFGSELAAIIVEPVPGNMNLIMPQPGFLKHLRMRCDQYGSLLIFDEVMTGFRAYWGGAHTQYGLVPDLSILGKVIGGGLPIGAVCGLHQWMQHLAPEGSVYQAGTFSGNPMSMACGLETLKVLSEHFLSLCATTKHLTQELNDLSKTYGIPFRAHHQGAMLGMYFHTRDVLETWEDIHTLDSDAFHTFFHHLLSLGIYIPPSPLETAFVSLAHQHLEIERTLEAVRSIFKNWPLIHSAC